MERLLLLMLCATAALADISDTQPTTGTCLCVCSWCEVNLRDKAGLSGTNVKKSAKGGECYEYLGKEVKKDGEHWFLISHTDGEVYWASGRFFNAAPRSDCGLADSSQRLYRSVTGCGVRYRSEWGATPPRLEVQFSSVPDAVVIHHSVGSSCSSSSRCKSLIRNIQHYHMNTLGWRDIGYNFIIGEDGNVYEGRGWDNVGAHTRGHNDHSLSFAFLGDFTNRKPNAAAISACKAIIQCGVDGGKIKNDYTLHGGRDLSSTASPGDALYAEIQTWDHFAGRG